MILVLGTSAFSKIIQIGEKLATGCDDYSHCGLCIKACDLPESSPLYHKDTIYVIEALNTNTDGVAAVAGTPQSGVQLRVLDDMLRANNSVDGRSLAWMSLKPELRPQVSPEFLLGNINQYLGRPYDFNPCTYFSAAFQFLRWLRCVFPPISKFCGETRQPLFCSKLAGEILRDCGVINATINTNNIMPVDYIPSPVNPNCTYDKDSEVPVIYNAPAPIELN